ncbi:protein yippee-like at4g27745, partial [Phtheirospermum japonicum]
HHVSLHDDINSKTFQGRRAITFLFTLAINGVVGAKEDMHLMTDLHMVTDVYCGGIGMEIPSCLRDIK